MFDPDFHPFPVRPQAVSPIPTATSAAKNDPGSIGHGRLNPPKATAPHQLSLFLVAALSPTPEAMVPSSMLNKSRVQQPQMQYSIMGFLFDPSLWVSTTQGGTNSFCLRSAAAVAATKCIVACTESAKYSVSAERNAHGGCSCGCPYGNFERLFVICIREEVDNGTTNAICRKGKCV